jgi:glucose-1-phosphate thymidylyltransferase
MKGIVLAGGLGTRLYPLTRITNKHLLPVYDRPMIFYPLETLVNAGITDILIVTGGNSAGDFLKLMGNGSEFGLKHLNYTYQEGEGGIAAALALAEHFADREPICVVLGDNIIEGSIADAVRRFDRTPHGAQIFLKEVPDAERFGVPVLRGNRVVRIEEKPKRPSSKYAVTGIYMYDARVFDVVRTLRPSGRGELEITDVNNWYIKRGELSYSILDGWWTDAGTFESLFRASQLVADAVHRSRDEGGESSGAETAGTARRNRQATTGRRRSAPARPRASKGRGTKRTRRRR